MTDLLEATFTTVQPLNKGFIEVSSTSLERLSSPKCTYWNQNLLIIQYFLKLISRFHCIIIHVWMCALHNYSNPGYGAVPAGYSAFHHHYNSEADHPSHSLFHYSRNTFCINCLVAKVMKHLFQQRELNNWIISTEHCLETTIVWKQPEYYLYAIHCTYNM